MEQKDHTDVQSAHRNPLLDVAAAVFSFAHSSNSSDELFIVDFGDRVSIGQLGGKPFTSDAKILEQAVLGVSARGQTALYDAVIEGLRHLELGSRERKALVIVSDGGDNASVHQYSEALALARSAHAVIYSIVLAGTSDEEENPRALERLCKDTGGIAFVPRPRQHISEVAEIIARDLREQYTLGYTPARSPTRNSFRKIMVQVAASGHSGLRVRTRTGYMASATMSSQPGDGGS